MDKENAAKFRKHWLSIPIVATITRLLCRELTLQNEHLRTENGILKSKIKGRVVFSDEERRTLTDAALTLGKDLLKKVVTIVKPETILAWQRKLERQKWDYSHRRKKTGRPRISKGVEELICQMARENMWGYKRIQGELKKLGIEISKSSVANILRKHKLPISPDRNGPTWKEFLARQAKVFLCADFFTKEVWTFKGLTRVFVFFVIHLESRRILLARATVSPNGQWLKQQLRHVIWECEDRNINPKFFLHDNGSCFSADFELLLKAFEIKSVRTPLKAPNANAHAERFVLSIKNECLNHLIFFGLDSLQHTIDKYAEYYNRHRPHQGIGNKLPDEFLKAEKRRSPKPAADSYLTNIIRKDFIGGLLKSYQKAA